MNDLNIIIGQNISAYRKKYNMTQLELAEKINYSDKSISKWEKGDGVPDIYVLKALADIFNVTVNDLITTHEDGKFKAALAKNKKIITIILSILLVWLTAIVFCVLLHWIFPNWQRYWLTLVYGIPISFIVAQVLCTLWTKKIFGFICSSGIVWSTILTFCLTFHIDDSWMLYFVGVPLQIMLILWYIYFVKGRKKN
ncbi:MAG: helix-turn-helix transcriptional regulator [Clostridia bacterium]|nr:helix-turn-helix transcriptional regulator [Clostridia bacterium]